MVEHVAILDADRHEPKHASTAANNQVLHANGDGTTQFKFVSYSNLVGVPSIKGYQNVLSAFSSGNQAPAAVDTPLQVSFGSPQSNAAVTLAADGTLTFNQSGDFAVTLFLRFGRTAGGGNAIVLTRFLVNDIQGLNTSAINMPDANSIVPFSTTLFVTVTAGTTFKLQIMRDSTGANQGGLNAFVPTLVGWNIAPSSTVVVQKYLGTS